MPILIPKIFMQELILVVVDGQSFPPCSTLLQSYLNLILVCGCLLLLGDANSVILKLLAPWLIQSHVSIKVEGILVRFVSHTGLFPDCPNSIFTNLITKLSSIKNKSWINSKVLKNEVWHFNMSNRQDVPVKCVTKHFK